MDQDNRVCVDCGHKTAEFFCSCTTPETFLCDNCLVKHTRRMSRKGHQPWPLAALLHYQNPQFLVRLEALNGVRVEAMKSIGMVEKTIAEFTAKIEEMQAALAAFCTEKVRQLQEIKACLSKDISAALEEVEKTLTQDQPLFASQYAALFRNRTEKLAPMELFTYKITSLSPLELVKIDFQLVNPQELLRHATLVGVYGNEAFLYGVESQHITRHTLSVNFGYGGSYVKISRDKVLCIGANPASASVYMLELPEFQLTPLPALSTPRGAAGVTRVNACVYVFGGQDGKVALRSCEKMNIATQTWTGLNNMNYSRGAFTPCLFHNLFYLVSAWSAAQRAIETFNIETESFAILPISLPPLLVLGNNSVAFVEDGELCLLTGGKQIARWRINTEREFRLSNTSEALWSNQQPLKIGPLLLIICERGVKQFSLETYSCIKYVK